MPVRLPDPVANPTRIYRRLQFGTLADLHMLDTRQYRDAQASSTNLSSIDDPNRTITGDPQMAWLKNGLGTSGPRWRLLGNQVMIAPVSFGSLTANVIGALLRLTGSPGPGGGVPFNPDQWDGYRADRKELLSHIADRNINNVVFLTGDIHSSWASDLPLNPAIYPLSKSVAVELVGTSVTSQNINEILGAPPRTASLAIETALRTTNRHLKYVELDSHGFSVVDVTPERLQMDWHYVSDPTKQGASLRFGKAFKVMAGSNKLSTASALV